MSLEIDFSEGQVHLERKESVEKQGKTAVYSGIADIYLWFNTDIEGGSEEEVRGRIKLKRTEPYTSYRREFVWAMPPWTEKKLVQKGRTIWKLDTKHCASGLLVMDYAQVKDGVLFANEYYIEKGYSLEKFRKEHWTYYKNRLEKLATSSIYGIAGRINQPRGSGGSINELNFAMDLLFPNLGLEVWEAYARLRNSKNYEVGRKESEAPASIFA